MSATPYSHHELVAVSADAASLLDLTAQDLTSDQFLQIFSGQIVPSGGHHIAQVYAGHQFGHFVPQLGDGRAIFLGEAKNSRGQHWDVQLKGAGQTPYSRMGDGRAVLRSSIREFLASEAMAALGVPSTRALAIVATNDPVYRESVETGAIVTRLAQTHIRFGHFEFLFHHGKFEQLNQLIEFCLQHYYPDCKTQDNPINALLSAIVKRTAKLIAHWQAVGFCHGVMNTDNMSILGDTLDYGPFAFMDGYQADYVCNHSDHQGRYSFENQPSIGLWNLNALAYTFSNHLSTEEITQILSQYEPTLVQYYQQLMQQKLGLDQWSHRAQILLGQYLTIMAANQSDYTLSFRALANLSVSDPLQGVDSLSAVHGNSAELSSWIADYRTLLGENSTDDSARQLQQNRVNPKFILRNYLAQQAIDQAKLGNYQEIETLMLLLSQPYAEHPEFAKYAEQTPEWGRNMVISCSS